MTQTDDSIENAIAERINKTIKEEFATDKNRYILKQVKDAVKEDATIIKIDVDKSPQVAQQFQMQCVPTLILFKNGKSVWRQSGVIQSKELINIINL